MSFRVKVAVQRPTAFADGERRLLGLSHLPGSPCYVVVWSAPASVSVER